MWDNESIGQYIVNEQAWRDNLRERVELEFSGKKHINNQVDENMEDKEDERNNNHALKNDW